MNTTTPEIIRPHTAARSDTISLPGRTPRTSLADRLALRAALWLVLWSTRPDRGHGTRSDPWLDRRRDADRAQREQAWLSIARHTHPY